MFEAQRQIVLRLSITFGSGCLENTKKFRGRYPVLLKEMRSARKLKIQKAKTTNVPT
jgi:hypothetical protein